MKTANYLLISRSFIPSVMLCGGVQLKELKQQGKLDFRFLKTAFLSSKQINRADVLIFVRGFEDYELLCLRKAKEAGKKTVYVLDDDLLNVPEGTSSADLYTDETKKNIICMITECDLFLTPSRNLLAKYGGLASKANLIEEPCIKQEIKTHEDVGTIRIGFAGSVDRTGDLNSIITSAVESIIEEYGNRVAFEFFGAKPDLVEKYNLKHIPYCNSYEQYCETMAGLNWDIGLAPMPETEFHKYKHYNKFVEYSAYGIAGIYSDCEPYVWAVKDGVNGLLCENTTEGWTAAIERLIEDKALRENISVECRKEAETVYSIETCAEQLYQLIKLHEGKTNKRVTGLEIARLMYLRHRVFSVIKKYGFRTIPETIKRIFD